MNARTRALSPLLPQLISSVARQLWFAEQRLAAATAAEPGAEFTVAGERWRRSPRPVQRQRYYQQYDVTATDKAGRRVDLSKAEDRAFWTWAAVEVLRHTGIRIEELLELTHLSLRPLRKPDGQIIPLLQIAPSKNDAERILPVIAGDGHGAQLLEGSRVIGRRRRCGAARWRGVVDDLRRT